MDTVLATELRRPEGLGSGGNNEGRKQGRCVGEVSMWHIDQDWVWSMNATQ